MGLVLLQTTALRVGSSGERRTCAGRAGRASFHEKRTKKEKKKTHPVTMRIPIFDYPKSLPPSLPSNTSNRTRIAKRAHGIPVGIVHKMARGAAHR